jgi:hypothetical protein
MHPNGLFLLAVGFCSFAVVVVFAVFMAIRAWKLIKRGLRISKVVVPLAEDLARKSEVLARDSYDIGLKIDEIAINLERIDASLHRLQVVFKAFADSMAPYRRVKDYFGM